MINITVKFVRTRVGEHFACECPDALVVYHGSTDKCTEGIKNKDLIHQQMEGLALVCI